MSVRSPFIAGAGLSELAALLQPGAGAGAKTHVAVTGLLGASRSLVTGALGLARAGVLSAARHPSPVTRHPSPVTRHPSLPSVVLLVVDGPETALDAVADLRAFLALHQMASAGETQSTAGQASSGTKRHRGSARANTQSEIRNPKSEIVNPQSPIPNPQSDVWLESALFPAWDVLPTESDHPEGLTLAGRRRVTDRLREIKAGCRIADDGCRITDTALPEVHAASYIIAAPVTALMQPAESPGDPGDVITLRAGDQHDPILLGRALMDSGYERVGQVEVRGEFSLRGGIMDIFPYTSDTPYRLDFAGDTIETIKPFDPLTQRSEESVPLIAFANASPTVLRRLFSPGAAAGPFSLLDHLPPGTLIVWEEPRKLRQRAELYRASLVSGRSVCFALEELLAKAQGKFDTLQVASGLETTEDTEHTEEKEQGSGSSVVLEKSCNTAGSAAVPGGRTGTEAGATVSRLAQHDTRVQGLGYRTSESAQESEIRNPESEPETFSQLCDAEPAAIACTTLQRVQGEIAAHAEAWRKLADEREQVVVFCETNGHRHRLQTLFDEAGLTPSPRMHLALGKLSGGFDLRAAGLAVACDREILGISKHAGADTPRRRQMAGTVAIHHLTDVQVGDHVVHAAHGIARYLGLARLEKSGRTEDYLTLLFADDVKLYVPAAHIGWVSKYIGGHAQLELSKLGGKAWARKKERASKAIRDIAEDLLRVQAARRNLPGIVYPPDNDWQEPFEKAFPYEETPDQLTAIREVKKDMEGTCPMDRLLCGDVGFGKTEVALRAAFKAVCSGKQVAVLAPTTLLVEQHGRTFRERLAAYPFAVEELSRFRTPAAQRRILERVATGRVDIVVGTHRLLQKDVRFKDLGLAIIDEEQRFGVEHKEFFKHLRKSVDVLTLTATPIPRTLHMAMIGLRDISNLATPPRNRRPIQTKVARLSEDLVRRAILREISRGGQVFVVHPRVYDIADFRDALAKLAPEARFAIGHGQMDGDDLEEVMGRFLRGEVDVLVSTTIVESGLDIPTANTILIHDAGRFGLAELHQLRGRVGRSELQAYCYLLLPEHSAVTPDGLRRLRALEEFDELGAGFQLALKDLEIRGAGNVLGREQSGEIAEIGYDLYCKLLEATVKGLRGEQQEEEIEVNLQLRGAAYIPESYVEDDRVVLELYRRLDAARSDAELDSLKDEALDRFGPLPAPAERMFEEARLRRLARIAHAPYVGLDNEEGRLIIKLHEWDLKQADRALRGVGAARGVRVLDDQTLSFGLSLKAKHDERALRELVRDLLEPLAEARQGGETGREYRGVAAYHA
jgi:transcription-repair coupling factor